MKAAVKPSATGPIEFAEFREPDVSDGLELVELVAAGIHPIVRSLADGSHYGSEDAYPLVPGVDAVARTASGELIYTGYVRAPWGTLAERMAAPGGFHLSLPAGADPAKVAGGMNAGISSWMPLQGRLKEVDALGTVLILGATGVAGYVAVQNAFALGASRVVAVGRDADGLARASALGAIPVRLTGGEDATSIGDALGDSAPSIVLDFVWGGAAEAAFVALGRHGLDEDDADIRYIEIGASGGAAASVPAALLRSRRIAISGSGAGSASVRELMAQLPVMLDLIATGKVNVPVTAYPLERVAEAWDAAAGSRSRVVVTN
jgi:NADPH:quinone reductase-like Zn-dependent oxidoreductase